MGFVDEGGRATLPEESRLRAAFTREVERVINRELDLRVKDMTEQIARGQGSPRLLNRLGVLYARYGKNEQALAQFERATRQSPYLPALLNIGNILFLEDRSAEALVYYERAQAISPDDPKVVLALARTHHELENYDRARAWYGMLKAMSPELAFRYTYLDLQGEAATRAASAGQKERVLWEDE